MEAKNRFAKAEPIFISREAHFVRPLTQASEPGEPRRGVRRGTF